MNDWVVSTAVGAVLVATGLLMMRAHLKAWREQKNDPSINGFDRAHYYTRFRRRMQTSGLLVLVGLLIPVGDVVIQWQNAPLLGALYWGAVLLLVLWIIVLGLSDLVVIRAHSRAALGRIRRQQRELEEQLDEIRRRASDREPDGHS